MSDDIKQPSPTEASNATQALRERLTRDRGRPDRIAAQLMEIGSRYAVLTDSGRSLDDILGYDEQGLPT
jgi:antitoxin VapB